MVGLQRKKHIAPKRTVLPVYSLIKITWTLQKTPEKKKKYRYHFGLNDLRLEKEKHSIPARTLSNL